MSRCKIGLALLLISSISSVCRGDGQGYIGKEPILSPSDKVNVYVPTRTPRGEIIYLEKLQPSGVDIYPFGWDGKGVRPEGVNYWYYFDNPRYTCRGAYRRVWEGTGRCNVVEEHDYPIDSKSIPEPPVGKLLLVCFIVFGILFNLKRLFRTKD
jgi:hypothetical protein